MKNNKFINSVAFLAVGFMAMSLVACSSSDNDSNASATVVSEDTSQSANSNYAKVTSIDGDTITAVLGEMNSGNRPDNGELPSGEMSDDEMPTGDMPDNGEMPSGDMPDNGEIPSGDMPDNGEMPSGEMSDGEMPTGDMPDNGGKSMFTESDETITFTVTDSTEITLISMDSTSKGSIEDLTTDSIIQYELDSSGNALSISIMNTGKDMSAEEAEE